MFKAGDRVRLITEAEYLRQNPSDQWGFRPKTLPRGRVGEIHHLSLDGDGAWVRRDGVKQPEFFQFHELRREGAPEDGD